MSNLGNGKYGPYFCRFIITSQIPNLNILSVTIFQLPKNQ